MYITNDAEAGLIHESPIVLSDLMLDADAGSAPNQLLLLLTECCVSVWLSLNIYCKKGTWKQK